MDSLSAASAFATIIGFIGQFRGSNSLQKGSPDVADLKFLLKSIHLKTDSFV